MDDFDREILKRTGIIEKTVGHSGIPVRIIAMLYFEPGEIAMDELAKKTGYSLASISNIIKMLEGTGHVERIKKPGTKKVYLYMHKNIIGPKIKTIALADETITKLLEAEIPEVIKKYKNKKLSERDKKRIELLEGYYEQIKIMKNILKILKKEFEKADKIYKKKCLKKQNEITQVRKKK